MTADVVALPLPCLRDAYEQGVTEGALIPETGAHDTLVTARMVWATQAVGFEGALNMANFAANAARTPMTEFLWACGVRQGWKDATEDRPDAHDCAMCDERVLSDTDPLAVQCTDHGWFDSDDCRNAFCRPACEWPES